MSEAGDRIGRVRVRFRLEPGLSREEQGSHDDFVRPYDRGHMTPANDAPDIESQRDTFVVTNIVPQVGYVNQHLWQYLEASVHQLAQVEGEVYIVTGPIFSADPPLMSQRIAIPAFTYKAIYVPSRNIAVGYIATNSEAPVCTVVSVAEVTRRTGIDPFPALPLEIKSQRPSFTLPRGINIVRGRRQQVPLPDCHPEGAHGERG